MPHSLVLTGLMLLAVGTTLWLAARPPSAPREPADREGWRAWAFGADVGEAKDRPRARHR